MFLAIEIGKVSRKWRARLDSNQRPLASEAKEPGKNPCRFNYLRPLPREAATRMGLLGLNANAFRTASASLGSTMTCV